MVEDVGDGEVILEGADYENYSREQDCGKGGDSGAARGLTQALGSFVLILAQ
jgi:hypothetical protein